MERKVEILVENIRSKLVQSKNRIGEIEELVEDLVVRIENNKTKRIEGGMND